MTIATQPTAEEEVAFSVVQEDEIDVIFRSRTAEVHITHIETGMVASSITHPVASMNYDTAMQNLRVQVANARRALWYAQKRE